MLDIEARASAKLVVNEVLVPQDDNLTSDTSNRRVLHGLNAKEQLSLTDRGKHLGT